MRTSPYVLEEKEADRLSSGTQAIKGNWTFSKRKVTAVNLDNAHEVIELAEPFELWESVRAS